jgi:hypothetical protein
MNRRSVLRQSVRLAYATPLIVATMGLQDAKAGHVFCTCPTNIDPCFEIDDELGCYRVRDNCTPVDLVIDGDLCPEN